MASRILFTFALFVLPGTFASLRQGSHLNCDWTGEYECAAFDVLYYEDGVEEISYPSGQLPPASFSLSDTNSEGKKYRSGLFAAIFFKDLGGPEPAMCTTKPWESTLAVCTDALDATITEIKFKNCGHVEMIQYEPATAVDFGETPFAARGTGCVLK